MYLLINILGIAIFLTIAILFSKKRRDIPWRCVGILLVIELIVAWFLTMFPAGRQLIAWLAAGFEWLMSAACEGVAFVFPEWAHAEQMNFFTTALLPILFIVPLFDILTYTGILPFCIRWIGKLLQLITREPGFESFFAIEMMFLGNSDAIAVSRLQLQRMKADRCLTIAMMSMSCVTAALLGSYIKMMPAEFVLTAVPLNVINALIVTNILHPVKVSATEDTVAVIEDKGRQKEPFFTFLSTSILSAGKLVLIIAATVITFISLVKFFDMLLMLIDPSFTLEKALGYIMFPFAWLMGLDADEAFFLAQQMGTKLITNEFVVMLGVRDVLAGYSRHLQGVLTVFVTSFANVATIGVILGSFRGFLGEGKNELIGRNVGYMFLSGVLVSLLSAGIAGIFIW
jgi:purine nucleoside transport protein